MLFYIKGIFEYQGPKINLPCSFLLSFELCIYKLGLKQKIIKSWNYVQRSMENCLLPDKFSFSSTFCLGCYLAFPGCFGTFSTDFAGKRL